MITLYQNCVVYEIGRDGYGKPIKKNERDLKCRVKEKYQIVKNNSAVETVSELEVILPKSSYINVDDKLEYQGKEYTIISLQFIRNTIGEIVYKKVYV